MRKHSALPPLAVTNELLASPPATSSCKACEKHELDIKHLTEMFEKMAAELQEVKREFAAHKQDFAEWSAAIERGKKQPAKESREITPVSVAGDKHISAQLGETSGGDAIERCDEKEYVLLEMPAIRIEDTTMETTAPTEKKTVEWIVGP